jgi:hypothetical protein
MSLRPLLLACHSCLIAFAVAAPACVSPIAETPDFLGPVASVTQNGVGQVQCVAYCRKDKPRTPVVEVRWRVSTQPLSANEMALRMNQQNLEVTVYKDGYGRGLYASLPSAAPTERFLMNADSPQAQSQIPGLSHLVVTDVVTSKEPEKGPNFELFAAGLDSAEWIIVKIEGVEPGLNYYWRLPSVAGNQTVVSCRASVCPGDRKSRPPG